MIQTKHSINLSLIILAEYNSPIIINLYILDILQLDGTIYHKYISMEFLGLEKKHIRNFQDFREEQTLRELKQTGDYRWNQYESSFLAYSLHFYRSGFDIRKFLENRANPVVVDFLGAGQALRDLKNEGLIHSGASVTLNDFRSKINPELIDQDLQNNLELIAGNVMSNSTWHKLDTWLTKQNQKILTPDIVDKEKIDLGMCNPGIGFFTFLHVWPSMRMFMVDRLCWQVAERLNPDSGVFISDLAIPYPEETNIHTIHKWRDIVNSNNFGVTIDLLAPDYQNREEFIIITRNGKIPSNTERKQIYDSNGL